MSFVAVYLCCNDWRFASDELEVLPRFRSLYGIYVCGCQPVEIAGRNLELSDDVLNFLF
jgi:hypothetical protein